MSIEFGMFQASSTLECFIIERRQDEVDGRDYRLRLLAAVGYLRGPSSRKVK